MHGGQCAATPLPRRPRTTINQGWGYTLQMRTSRTPVSSRGLTDDEVEQAYKSGAACVGRPFGEEEEDPEGSRQRGKRGSTMARSSTRACWALLLVAGALAAASAQDIRCCLVGDCGACSNGVDASNWCGEAPGQCEGCAGVWCDATAQPLNTLEVAIPVAAAASCCFYSPSGDMCGDCGSHAVDGDWCLESEANCAQCGGSYCPGSGAAPVPVPVPVPNPIPGPVPSPIPGPVPTPVPSPVPTPVPDPVPTPGPVPVPTPGPAGNPFSGQTLYVNPTFSENIATSIATAAPGAEMDNLQTMSGVASAYWLDTMAKVIPGDDATTLTAAGILKDAAAQSPVPLVTLIVYDLPNRDCHAKASNGEICCGGTTPQGPCDYLDAAATGTCDQGLETYRTSYIDNLATIVSQYCGVVPMAFVIEPDSLPNLATNSDDPKCGSLATSTAYKEGIAYAVTALNKACPSSALYLDGAHGGWLGWSNNAEGFAKDVASLGVANLLRGFSLNVANYQDLGLKCPQVGWCLNGQNQADPCCYDPCGLSTQYNAGHNELNYAEVLHDAVAAAIPGFDPRMIIDTGRNARSPRADCANWCNARGAGTGVFPSAQTGNPLVDAYLWLKTPGESDGCTEVLPTGEFCPRFDSFCGSADSIGSAPGEPRAPEAGDWFDYQVKMLARNAKFQ